jgi:toxin FitB
MKFLLDTCVLSDGMKGRPNPGLTRWLEIVPVDDRYVSVLSLAEIQFGIHRLAQGQKKDALARWYEKELRPTCGTRVLPFDEPEAVLWAQLRVRQPNATFVDTQLAATALVNEMTIVTRNVVDFKYDGLDVFNPWED